MRPAENSTMSATIRLPDSRWISARRGAAPPAIVERERLDRLAQAERDVAVAHLVDQLVDDLAVEELERPLAPLDDGDLDAERGEDRRVLDADHAGADDGQRPRQARQSHDVVGREDAPRRPRRRPEPARASVPDGDHDVGGRDLRACPCSDAIASVCGSTNAASPAITVTSLRRSCVLDHLDLAADHAVDAREQLRARRPPVEPRPRQAIALARDARVHDDGLAQGLARDRAGLDADAADAPAPLDDRRPLPELRRLHRRALAGRPAARRDEVEVEGRTHRPRPAVNPTFQDIGDRRYGGIQDSGSQSRPRGAPGPPAPRRRLRPFCRRVRSAATRRASARGCQPRRQGVRRRRRRRSARRACRARSAARSQRHPVADSARPWVSVGDPRGRSGHAAAARSVGEHSRGHVENGRRTTATARRLAGRERLDQSPLEPGPQHGILEQRIQPGGHLGVRVIPAADAGVPDRPVGELHRAVRDRSSPRWSSVSNGSAWHWTAMKVVSGRSRTRYVGSSASASSAVASSAGGAWASTDMRRARPSLPGPRGAAAGTAPRRRLIGPSGRITPRDYAAKFARA